MDDATADMPIHTISVDPNELAKCTSSELRAYFDDLLHLEKTGYISRDRTPKAATASIDLDKYASIENFIDQCRRIIYLPNTEAMARNRLAVLTHRPEPFRRSGFPGA